MSDKATEEQRQIRDKHLRGKRREAFRARRKLEAALRALGEEV